MLQILSTSNETSTGAELVQNGNFSELGSDLVTNGDFSAAGSNLVSNPNFTDTGSELITNGDFATGDMTGWSVGSSGDGVTPTAVSDGSGGYGALISNGVTGGNSYIIQNSVFEVGKSYKVSYRIVSNSLPLTNFLVLENYDVAIPSTVGTHDIFVVGLSTELRAVFKRSGEPNTNIVITDISVKELGADWTAADAGVMSFPEEGLKITAVNHGVGDNRVYQTNVTEDNKSYKYTITIEDITAGCNIRIYDGSSYINPQSTTGTFYYTRQGTNDSFYIALFGTTSVTDFVTISSISVQEVGQGWEASGTNGGIVTFPNGMARIQSDNSAGNAANIYQDGIMEVGKSYTMTYRIVSNNGGDIYNYAQTPSALDSTVGSHSVTFIAGNDRLLFNRVNGTVVDVSITNVTLTQVGSGNLERWWRMNGTEPLLINLPNEAPNGIVDDLNEINSPGISPDVP